MKYGNKGVEASVKNSLFFMFKHRPLALNCEMVTGVAVAPIVLES